MDRSKTDELKGEDDLKRIIRLLSILLVIALILPGFSIADGKDTINIQQEELYQRVTEKFREEPIDKIDRNDTNQLYSADDEVRIIVELESEPSIVRATKSKVSYDKFTSADRIEKDIEAEQQKVKNSIIASRIDMKFIHNFKTAFNGFSGKVRYEDIKKIEKLPSVKKVYIANEYERPEPNLETSKDMIDAIQTWNIGYKGEGTVIAIIDSGIDPSHRDMVLSEGTVPKLTKEDVEGKDLLGKYYTEKVPYGYNYYDLNYEIRDTVSPGSEHGMHVAGIAAANGDVENGGVKGVAPEAQLLAMKVFSNDPIYSTTFSDIYLKAIDEAVKLGADVLNMSLGSTASFYIPDSAEDIALRNATDNGIVCSVSAGNSGSFTYGWTSTNYGYPWKENPDIGVVGAPGLNKDTIQVASVDNTHQKMSYLEYELNGEKYQIPMAVAGSIEPSDVLTGPQEFVDGGSGHPSELTNVEGKIALIVRGGLTPNFVDKLQNAQNAGAIGVIVYNHESGGEELVNMMTPANLKIPAVFIGHKGGLALMELEDKYVVFPAGKITVQNPTGGYLSDFTSWGTTPSLELKPEITAPGGQIYSTLNGNKYGTMGGTSMAAPHVAGGSALVMEYIKEHEKYKDLPLSEQARLAKVLLMNTAEILVDEDEYAYSPRRQGAGLMNLYGAVTTPVRVVNAKTNEAKVELKDFDDTSFTMKFKAINDSDTDATYDVDVIVLKDYIYDLDSVQLNLLSSDYIDADIDAPETITVPANGEIVFEVKVDIDSDSSIYRNMFVEGFVVLTDPNDENPELSVPYVGFYGDWGEPKIIDGMRFIDPVGTSYFNVSGMLYVDYEGYAYYYATPDRIYMSPGTMDGFIFGTDNVLPYLSFLRNAEVVNYNILDAEYNKLRTILTQNYYRKDYVDGGRYNPVSMVMDAWWFGDVNGEILPDGDYFYEIEAKIHYDDAKFQSKRIPITIDTVAPEIINLKFDPETNKLSWNVVEDGSGVLGFLIDINGEETDREPVIVDSETLSYELDLSEYIGVNNIIIMVVDNAYNVGIYETTIDIDNPDPYIYLLKPILLDVIKTNEVTFEGYVTKFELLDKVLVNGEEADTEFVEYVDILHPEDPSTILYSGPAYHFKKTITLEDGYHEIRVEAISKSGARDSIVRRFYVDTTAPQLDIAVTSIDAKNLKAELEIIMFDNLGYLTLYMGDSQIYAYEEPLVEPKPEEKIIKYTVDIKEGENVFKFTLVDIAGYKTVKEIVVDSNVITNIQPSEDVVVKAGEQVEISFNAPVGGEGYYKILLPYGMNSVNGVPMEEISPGLYTAKWTAPEGTIASGLQVQVTFVDIAGNEYSSIAKGRISIVEDKAEDMENLPANTVIVGNEAYDLEYLNKNASAQRNLIRWVNAGKEVYIKTEENILVTIDNEPASFEDLPGSLTYYDKDGNITYYKK